MSRQFRIRPKDKLIIEWSLNDECTRWGFYRVCDSPNDAKRSLGIITGQIHESDEQMDLLEVIT